MCGQLRGELNNGNSGAEARINEAKWREKRETALRGREGKKKGWEAGARGWRETG